MTPIALRIAGVIIVAVAAAACGKKGPPLPPLRPVPARIADMTALRTDGQVELRFTVPEANTDGSTPVVIDRVDVYAAVGVPDVPPPLAGQIASNPDNLRRSLPVRRPLPEGVGAPPTPVATVLPAPGDVAVFVDRIDVEVLGDAPALYYVAVPVVGSGRGRPGPPTPIANVPLGPLPEPPADFELTHDETHVRGTWQSADDGHVFYVYRVVEGREDERLTPEPLAANEVTVPVEFGRETCLRVRAVEASGGVMVQGPVSTSVCLTPVDTYPPPTPTGLRIVQEGAAVAVMWEAVAAADLAGYIVLRGNGDNGPLAPLMDVPVRETTFRDVNVQAGATYRYAVYAVDTAPMPNASEPSASEAIIVR